VVVNRIFVDRRDLKRDIRLAIREDGVHQINTDHGKVRTSRLCPVSEIETFTHLTENPGVDFDSLTVPNFATVAT